MKNNGVMNCILEAQKVATQLNILIPVGMAITVVAVVKQARESTSNPTLYI